MSELTAKITGIEYKYFLCRDLEEFDIQDIDKAIENNGSFLVNIKKNKMAVSWWVSAKRTRSYPYARVYDTLSFSGRKVTIIPVFKDEGAGGDRDFLQWDTISLMSLLDVYVIIAHYVDAKVNPRFSDKITNQRFNYKHLNKKINELIHYRSSALHWNMLQVEKIAAISKEAGKAYAKISHKTGVAVHAQNGIDRRIREIVKGRESFMIYSRELARRAQHSESRTQHAKEKLSGTKGTITIKNYLGGSYHFTSDEIEVKKKNVFLVEGKNTQHKSLPALEDIKDGLLKLVIFCNLKEVKLDGQAMKSKAALKLTASGDFKVNTLSKTQKNVLKLLKKEAKENGFEIIIER